MLRLVWTASALDDLHHIVGFIADRNLAAAERLQAAIEDTVERLPERPFLYRPGRVAGTREAVAHPNYIVVYRVGLASIDVLAVVHSRQLYP